MHLFLSSFKFAPVIPAFRFGAFNEADIKDNPILVSLGSFPLQKLQTLVSPIFPTLTFFQTRSNSMLNSDTSVFVGGNGNLCLDLDASWAAIPSSLLSFDSRKVPNDIPFFLASQLPTVAEVF